MRAALVLTALVGLLAVPAAGGHLGRGKPGYNSTVKRIQPPLPGVKLSVLGGEDRVILNNQTGKVLTVVGYRGEPYLRFGPDGVYENTLSPAKYLNSTRYARVAVPKAATPTAKPRWKKLAASEVWSWHDHRIHWMSTVAPPSVRAAPRRAHHIFDWKLPLLVGDRSYNVDGTLDYKPPPRTEDGGIPLLVIGIVAVAVAIILAFVTPPLLRWRRSAA